MSEHPQDGGLPHGEPEAVVAHWNRLIADEPRLNCPPLWPQLLVLARLLAQWDEARIGVEKHGAIVLNDKGVPVETVYGKRERQMANNARLATANLSASLATWIRRAELEKNKRPETGRSPILELVFDAESVGGGR